MLDAVLDRVRSLIEMPGIDPDVPVIEEGILQERIGAGDDLVVCFYADWCGFCRAFMPTYEDAAGELPLEAVAANISDYQDPRWSRFDVDQVPTLIAFRGGEEVARVDGRAGRGLSRDAIERLAEEIPA